MQSAILGEVNLRESLSLQVNCGGGVVDSLAAATANGGGAHCSRGVFYGPSTFFRKLLV